jgi:hypothetical protein
MMRIFVNLSEDLWFKPGVAVRALTKAKINRRSSITKNQLSAVLLSFRALNCRGGLLDALVKELWRSE